MTGQAASFGFVAGAVIFGALMFAIGYAVAGFKSVSDQVGPRPNTEHLCQGGLVAMGSWIECPVCGPASWRA